MVRGEGAEVEGLWTELWVSGGFNVHAIVSPIEAKKAENEQPEPRI